MPPPFVYGIDRNILKLSNRALQKYQGIPSKTFMYPSEVEKLHRVASHKCYYKVWLQ